MSNYDNLEQIIDEEIDSQLELTEINSAWEADRLIGIIKKNKEEAKVIEQRAKEVIDNYKYKVGLWKEKSLETLENQNKYMMKMLTDYYMKYSDGKTKMRFPNGNLGFYAVREKIEWEDEKSLISYIEEAIKIDSSLSGLLRMKPELNKEEIKANMKFNNEGQAVINGIVLPHISHVEKHNEVNVK